MKRVIFVAGVILINTVHPVRPGGPPDIPVDMGVSPNANDGLDFGASPYRMKRTKSESFIAQKLQEQLDQMRKEQESSVSKEEETPSQQPEQLQKTQNRSTNTITSSLTQSMQTENSVSQDFRINSLDIAAKLIRLREDQKSTKETVITILQHVDKIDKKFSSTRLCCGVSTGVVVTCQCFLLLFIAAAVASLLASNY